jgi:hypothetical protein
VLRSDVPVRCKSRGLIARYHHIQCKSELTLTEDADTSGHFIYVPPLKHKRDGLVQNARLGGGRGNEER